MLEVYGEYEIEGADDDVMVLGAKRRRRGKRPARAVVSRKSPSESRMFPLGVDSVSTIAASATATISVQPQVPFRLERFAVEDSGASNFVVNDVKVGKNSQFISSDAVSAEVFSAKAFGVQLRGDTAQVSQIISVSVTNLDGVTAHRFLGAFIGTALQ